MFNVKSPLICKAVIDSWLTS